MLLFQARFYRRRHRRVPIELRLVIRVSLRGFLDLLEQASEPLVLVSDFRR